MTLLGWIGVHVLQGTYRIVFEQDFNKKPAAGKIFMPSPVLLREYRCVRLRPTLSRRHGLSKAEIDQILSGIPANAMWREPPPGNDHTPSEPQTEDRFVTRVVF